MTTTDKNLQRRMRSMPQMIADDIRIQLVSGELVPGQLLPPEKQLMDTYGISRPTLREAIQILQAETVVETIRGAKGGVVVKAPDASVVIRQVGVLLQLSGASFADVYAARSPIEIAAVRALAQRARTDDIEALRSIIEEAKVCVDGGGEEFGRFAGRFHRAVVHRAGNTTMSFVVDMLASLTDALYNRKVTTKELAFRQAAAMKAIRSWAKLVDLLEAHDMDRAEAHWTKHLASVGANVGAEAPPLAAEVLPQLAEVVPQLDGLT